MLDLLSLDGSTLLRIDGIPEDAQVVGVTYEPLYDHIVFTLESRSFRFVLEGQAIEELRLNVTTRKVEGPL